MLYKEGDSRSCDGDRDDRSCKPANLPGTAHGRFVYDEANASGAQKSDDALVRLDSNMTNVLLTWQLGKTCARSQELDSPAALEEERSVDNLNFLDVPSQLSACEVYRDCVSGIEYSIWNASYYHLFW